MRKTRHPPTPTTQVVGRHAHFHNPLRPPPPPLSIHTRHVGHSQGAGRQVAENTILQSPVMCVCVCVNGERSPPLTPLHRKCKDEARCCIPLQTIVRRAPKRKECTKDAKSPKRKECTKIALVERTIPYLYMDPCPEKDQDSFQSKQTRGLSAVRRGGRSAPMHGKPTDTVHNRRHGR